MTGGFMPAGYSGMAALSRRRALRLGLPEVLADPTGLDGREHALYGSYLAAVAFCSAGSGLHHKICHLLGGADNLPHRNGAWWPRWGAAEDHYFTTIWPRQSFDLVIPGGLTGRSVTDRP
jgi:hypothetical protein